MADVRIVHKMPVSEYGSVKKRIEEWYNHLMICPIGSLPMFHYVFAGVKLNFKI
jgi:hypothetical protein